MVREREGCGYEVGYVESDVYDDDDGAWRSETTMPAFNAIAVEIPCAFVAVFMRG